MKNGGPPNKSQLEEDLSVHILSASAAMVGVCLTVIGLIRIVITLGKSIRLPTIFSPSQRHFSHFLFLFVLGLRTRGTRRMHRLERIADAAFLLGLLLMVAVCGVITFAMI